MRSHVTDAAIIDCVQQKTKTIPIKVAAKLLIEKIGRAVSLNTEQYQAHQASYCEQRTADTKRPRDSTGLFLYPCDCRSYRADDEHQSDCCL